MAAPSSCDRFGLAAYLARRGWPLVPTVGPPLCREVVEEPPLRLARGCRSAVGCGARTAAISLVQIGGGENMCMEACVCVGACVACVCVCACVQRSTCRCFYGGPREVFWRRHSASTSRACVSSSVQYEARILSGMDGVSGYTCLVVRRRRAKNRRLPGFEPATPRSTADRPTRLTVLKHSKGASYPT